MKLKQAEKFEITFKEKVMVVEVISIGGQTLYKITSDNKSFFITRAKDFNAGKFWTSIPEGKQYLAEEIGKLIQQHYKHVLL